MLTDDMRAAREKIVLDHFRDEVAQRWDDVLSTFPHPRYELIPAVSSTTATPQSASTTSTPASPSPTSATR